MIRFICLYLLLFSAGLTFQLGSNVFDLNQQSSINGLKNGHVVSGASSKTTSFEPVEDRKFSLSGLWSSCWPEPIESHFSTDSLNNVLRLLLSRSIGSRSPPFFS